MSGFWQQASKLPKNVRKHRQKALGAPPRIVRLCTIMYLRVLNIILDIIIICFSPGAFPRASLNNAASSIVSSRPAEVANGVPSRRQRNANGGSSRNCGTRTNEAPKTKSDACPALDKSNRYYIPLLKSLHVRMAQQAHQYQHYEDSHQAYLPINGGPALNPCRTPSRKVKIQTAAGTPMEGIGGLNAILVSKTVRNVVPADLPPSVLAPFAQKRDILHKDGLVAPGCAQLTKQVCQAIKIKTEIPAVSPKQRMLGGRKVFAFSRSSTKFENGNLGCGDFGPKGQNVIETTLQALSDGNAEGMTSNDLYASLSQLLDTPQPWDFKSYFSVQVLKDLEIDLNEAIEVLENSGEYGRLFNRDLPEKMDIGLAVNPESSQPLRHRKSAVNLKPAAREKKSAKVVEKPKKSKSPKKSKQKGKAEVKIPVHGTRGAKTRT
ncbi:hypothetical protein B0H11DRAFT_1917254 [Mycena galericulata]|nr:hypothetical protein B0H11DRAFT_1917254 [Mycena galericulata]